VVPGHSACTSRPGVGIVVAQQNSKVVTQRVAHPVISCLSGNGINLGPSHSNLRGGVGIKKTSNYSGTLLQDGHQWEELLWETSSTKCSWQRCA
jgi:hypothetical protein